MCNSYYNWKLNTRLETACWRVDSSEVTESQNLRLPLSTLIPSSTAVPLFTLSLFVTREKGLFKLISPMKMQCFHVKWYDKFRWMSAMERFEYTSFNTQSFHSISPGSMSNLLSGHGFNMLQNMCVFLVSLCSHKAHFMLDNNYK